MNRYDDAMKRAKNDPRRRLRYSTAFQCYLFGKRLRAFFELCVERFGLIRFVDALDRQLRRLGL